MGRGLLLTLWLHRVSAVTCVAAVALLSIGLIGLAGSLRSAAAGCTASDPANLSDACLSLSLVGTIGDDAVNRLLPIVGIAPFLLGAVLGAPIVAQERERRTALLAWSWSPSRTRWLLASAIPLFALGLLLSVDLAIVGDVVERAHAPAIDASRSLANYGDRGPVLVTRFAVAFMVSLFVGTLLRRTLPALVVAVATGTVIAAGLAPATAFWVAPEIVAGPQSPIEIYQERMVEPVYVRPDGTRLGLEDGRAIDPGFDNPALGRLETYAIPGSRYRDVVFREAAVTALLCALVGAGVVLALRRASP